MPLALAALVALAAVAVVGADDLADLPPDLPHRYGVVGLQAEVAAGDTLRVARVRLHSPAHRAGLRAGDLLLGAGPYRVRTSDDLSRAVESFEPGSQLEFRVLRDGRVLRVPCAVTDRRGLYSLMDEDRSPPPAEGARHRRWRSDADPLAADAAMAIAAAGAGGVLDSLQTALRLELARYGGDGRLADVDFALAEPLLAVAPARALADSLLSGSVAGRLRRAARHLDAGAPSTPAGADTVFASLAGSPLYEPLLAPVARAGQWVEAACADLSAAQRQALLAGAVPLLGRFHQTFYLDLGDSAETEGHIRTLRLAKRVRTADLVEAGLVLAALAEAPALDRVVRAARGLRGHRPAALPEAFGGDFAFAAQTAWGWVLVGGAGPNVYGADAAIIVDLGGDDLYVGDGGAPHLRWSRSIYEVRADRVVQSRPAGVVIDLDGDDRYLGNGPGSLGGALGGVGLLLDRRGNDIYSGDLLTQGAAFCGVGLLVDGGGNDAYLAQKAAQGCAFFGVGLLLDAAGNDLFCAAQFAQGFGGPSGLGALCDLRGRDRYVADGAVPSGYGTEDAFNGWSQGVGCGLRGYAAGGIGVLVDGGGDDSYQAGNFSQGTGYFFALGVLADRRGRDRYRGSRYCQGASAHQAIGVLLDGAGDDVYSGTIAANQAGAWDTGVAVLEDAAGDDRYEGAGLAQGAAAMNGFGLLRDGAGDDVYRAGDGQGLGDGTSYWGGRDALNLGLLIDGGGRDSYDREGREDGTAQRTGSVGLFVDR